MPETPHGDVSSSANHARGARRNGKGLKKRLSTLASSIVSVSKEEDKTQTKEDVTNEKLFGDEAYSNRTPYTIHPKSKFISSWNVVNACFIIVCAFFLPFQLAFGYEYGLGGTMDQAFWAIIWPLMDFYFFVDLFINFRLCYYDDGELEDNPSMIVQHYIRTWFSIDIVSVSASVLEVVASGLGIARSVKIIKLLKLLKLLRVARLQKLIDELGDVAHEARIFVRLLKLFISVMGFAHVIACGWWAVGPMSTWDAEVDWEDQPLSWYTKYYQADHSTQSTSDKYWAALYWAFTTVTTVGFGDITPATTIEMRYCVVTAFIGTALFAFITGEITAMATTRQASSTALAEKVGELEEFMRFYKLPQLLRKTVRKHYEASFNECYFNDRAILYDLPPDMAQLVRKSIKCAKISNNPWFKVVTIEKSHSVSMKDDDLKALIAMDLGEDSVKLSTLQYKKDYDVTICNTGTRQRVKARELVFMPGEGNQVVWQKTLTKTDKRTAMFNYMKETEDLFSEIVGAMMAGTVEPNSYLYKEGDEANEMILLEEGEISICETSNRLLAGSMLGFCTSEFTKLENVKKVFSDSFVAVTKCRISVLKQKDLMRILASHGNAKLYGFSADASSVDLRQLLSVSKACTVFKSNKELLHGVKLNSASPSLNTRRVSLTGRLKGTLQAANGKTGSFFRKVAKGHANVDVPPSIGKPGGWEKGDQAVVTKMGTQKGSTVIVIDPDWDGVLGRMKVRVDGTEIVKSYLQSDLSKVQVHNWKKGDCVVIAKPGSQNGKTATVIDPAWNRAGGRVKVQSDHDNIIRSYHYNELKKRSHVDSPDIRDKHIRLTEVPDSPFSSSRKIGQTKSISKQTPALENRLPSIGNHPVATDETMENRMQLLQKQVDSLHSKTDKLALTLEQVGGASAKQERIFDILLQQNREIMTALKLQGHNSSTHVTC